MGGPSVLAIVILLLFGVLYQGIMELSEKLSNPLGADDIDLPEAAYHNFMHQECEAFFDASKHRFWMSEGDLEDERILHNKMKEDKLRKDMEEYEKDEERRLLLLELQQQRLQDLQS